MDYSKYRKTAGEGHAVSVNHRALITRALTKYPVDHALFRELLQNSADAKASSATIQFHSSSTDTNPSSIHTIPINRLLFSNDGDDFYEDDWNRLKEIASGNPNESKIGAFGVGFYSVFEITDEPLVHSGKRIVSFKYRDIQLQFFDIDAPSYQKGTLIDLPYKHEDNLKNVGGFIGFLIQSFLLINLKEITVEVIYANNTKINLLHLEKSDGLPRLMQLPSSFKHLKSSFFNLDGIQKTDFSVTGRYLNAAYMPPLTLSKGMFSFGKQLLTTFMDSPKNPDEYTEFNCKLLRVDAKVAVSANQKFREKITESLLKPPPRKTTISLLSIGDSEGESATSLAHLNSQLRPYVFPEDPNDAKIFIGFSTKQSTGFRLHLALQSAIPTMERTAIDLSHNYVKEWNYELLRVAGMVARIAYEAELTQCKNEITNGSASLADNLAKAKFVCSRYKFEYSAPDKTIGEHVKAGFYGCASQSLVPSTKGILPNTVVKYTDKKLAPLLKHTPIIEDADLVKDLSRFVQLYKASPADIARDVSSEPLTLSESNIYVSWLRDNTGDLSDSDRVRLASCLKVRTAGDKIIDVGSATSYHDRTILHSNLVANNLPPKCIPADVAQEIGHNNLAYVFRIPPLSVVEWTQLRIEDLRQVLNSKNPPASMVEGLAFEILQVASECWSQLDTAMKHSIGKNLGSVRCIPTNVGLQYPKDCYIEPIKGFSSFPVATKKFSSEWLEAIGVRRSISMEIVLSNLSKDELDWSNSDLIDYLTMNQTALKKSDWQVLIQGTLFRSNNHNGLYKASSLYAPDKTLTELGFPTLDYHGWNPSSSGAKLMKKLQLMQYPSEVDLFQRAINLNKHEKAISYFLAHSREAGYSIHRVMSLPFVPTTQANVYSTPDDCFWDPNVKVFHKKVISREHENVAERLGVRKAPSTRSLLCEVAQNPAPYLTSHALREGVFAYFSQHLGDLNDTDVRFCRDKDFIPMDSKDGLVWYRPSEVFLPSPGDEDEAARKIRHLLPTFMTTSRSLPFLSFIGVRDKPSPQQLVHLIVDDPAGAYKKLNDKDIYEQILCIIGKSWHILASDAKLVNLMKTTRFLVGEKRVNNTVSISLCRFNELSIVDDAFIFQQFKHLITTAPQDKDIEVLYKKLGTPDLSSLLEEEFSYKSEIDNPNVRDELKQRIEERLKLFIENTTSQLKTRDTSVNIKLFQTLAINRRLPPHAMVHSPLTCFYEPKSDTLFLVPHKVDWLEVAKALCKKVLYRPDQDSVVVLELQLGASLSDLERKGYNIDRLKRSTQSNHSLEKYLTSSKDSKPQEQQKHVKSQKHSYAHDEPKMPGAFPTPQPPPPSSSSSSSQKSSISKSFTPPSPAPKLPTSKLPMPKLPIPNLGSMSSSFQPPVQAHTRSQETGPVTQAAPPSSSSSKSTGISSWVNKMFGSSGSNTPKESESQEDQIKRMNHVLQQGASNVRQFNGSTLNSSGMDPGGSIQPAKDPNFNCGSGLDHNLTMVKTLSNGIKVFKDQQNTSARQDELVLGEKLLWLARIYNLPPKSIHIFREKSITIAFNQNGALFFNSYHLPDTSNEMDFWYTVMAHELAHNMCGPHNATHSFYTEAYIRNSLRRYIGETN